MSRRVTHFEIFGDNPAALARFYREMFGWIIERAPGVDYWRIDPGKPGNGAISGGLTYRTATEPRHWVHYVNVESLDDSIAVAERLGGRVMRPKTAVPKTAWYAVMADPDGNTFAIWQADQTAFPPPEPD
jgi:uncharacterized protein